MPPTASGPGPPRYRHTDRSRHCRPAPPVSGVAPPANSFGTRYTGTKPTSYTPATHTTNYPENFQDAPTQQLPNGADARYDFGPGQVGKWQTKSDSMEDGITADLEYTHANGRLEHHRQPAIPGDLLELGAVSTSSHRLRRHGVPDHDRRHPAAARERDDRAPSVGLGARTTGSTGSPATTRSTRA